MWIKILLAVLVVGGCSAVGFGKSSSLSNRVHSLKQSLLMTEKMQACLQYERMTTPELIFLLSRMQSMERLIFLPVCYQMLTQGKPFPSSWKEALEQTYQQMNLEKEDRSTIALIGELLGSTDAQSQSEELGMIQSLLKQCLETAEQGQKEKGKLYRSLGILSGIGLAILMI